MLTFFQIHYIMPHGLAQYGNAGEKKRASGRADQQTEACLQAAFESKNGLFPFRCGTAHFQSDPIVLFLWLY